MPTEDAINAIRRVTKPDKGVILGLSGGGDSVYLLHALLAALEGEKCPMLAVHIHHGIRGKDADEDEKFCEALCKRLGVSFLPERVDVRGVAKENGLTLEQAGREVRRSVFLREAKKMIEDHPDCSGVGIFLAHHANDQEETVLMHLLRGSGPAGLAGMSLSRQIDEWNERPICLNRPLLNITHEQILDSLRKRNIFWREDATNEELDYTRNWLRGKILPQIKEVYPAFTKTCGREAKLFRELEEYMEKQADGVLEENAKKSKSLIRIPVKVLGELHPALLRAVVRRCLQLVDGGLVNISASHIESIEELLKKQSGKQICLPRGVRVSREFDWLCFMSDKGEDEENDEKELSWEIEALSGEETGQMIKKIRAEHYTKLMDYDKIVEYCKKGEPVLRYPEEGDVFIFNRQGKKKSLATYLKQEKIPARRRGRTQVVAWGKHILWVPGHADSPFFFVGEETTRILKLMTSRKGEKAHDGRRD